MSITVPPEDAELGWATLLDLSKQAAEAACPGELEHFDDVAEAFRADPGWILRRPVDPPVGAGVDLAMLTPYLMALGSYLLGIVSQSITDGAADALRKATGDRLRALLRRKRAEPVAIENGPVVLDERQEKEVFELLVTRAVALGMDEERARIAAESVITALRMRAEEDRPE